MNISFDSGIKVKISMGSEKVRIEDLSKWLGRNRDAVLVKLEGKMDPSAKCRVGHICRIEKNDDQKYDVFVGKHVIGSLPDDAIAFSERVNCPPEFLVSIIGEIEYGASAEDDKIFIYIAE